MGQSVQRVRAAEAHGAPKHVRGELGETGDARVRPALLGGVTDDMEAYREELFGPVGTVYRATDVDDAVRIGDAEALGQVFDLLRHEGLSVGGSAGLNVAAAIRVARDLGPGRTVVTILCDGGSRYQSKLFNPEFLRSKGLPAPDWLVGHEHG